MIFFSEIIQVQCEVVQWWHQHFLALYWQSFVISDRSIHFDRKLLDQTKSCCCNQEIASTAIVKSDCAHCNISFYFLLHSRKNKQTRDLVLQ